MFKIDDKNHSIEHILRKKLHIYGVLANSLWIKWHEHCQGIVQRNLDPLPPWDWFFGENIFTPGGLFPYPKIIIKKIIEKLKNLFEIIWKNNFKEKNFLSPLHESFWPSKKSLKCIRTLHLKIPLRMLLSSLPFWILFCLQFSTLVMKFCFLLKSFKWLNNF